LARLNILVTTFYVNQEAQKDAREGFGAVLKITITK